MKTVCEANMCSGCMLCQEICPKNAIKVYDNIEYFNSIIDEAKCIECNICHNLCPVNNCEQKKEPIQYFQGWSLDEKVRLLSSSGGGATELIYSFLKKGGIVFGCTFENGIFGFKFVDSPEKAKVFQGSKYVKSNPFNIYIEIREKLKHGDKILFIGLPCQVSALKNFVGSNLGKHLYTIDLICHGTPSTKLLDEFLSQYNVSLKNLDKLEFRKNNRFKIVGDKKQIGLKGVADTYILAFLEGVIYTENCYNCKYADIKRVSDITLGDSWGTNLSLEEQKKGISLILCQTEKGYNLLKNSNLFLTNVDLDNAVIYNRQLMHPSEIHKNRVLFFEKIRAGKKFNNTIFRCIPFLYLKQIIKYILIRFKVIKGDN